MGRDRWRSTATRRIGCPSRRPRAPPGAMRRSRPRCAASMVWTSRRLRPPSALSRRGGGRIASSSAWPCPPRCCSWSACRWHGSRSRTSRRAPGERRRRHPRAPARQHLRRPRRLLPRSSKRLGSPPWLRGHPRRHAQFPWRIKLPPLPPSWRRTAPLKRAMRWFRRSPLRQWPPLRLRLRRHRHRRLLLRHHRLRRRLTLQRPQLERSWSPGR
jgi:hypothetical protein